ncbi:MAG: hypothetical protein DRN95_07620 [Candidatus Hydrothermarchaeota archaeon]|nr:MAG: hypothetical protein DRN95_07620 [Candidatus Hydrothermarchaeota archaeon]
MNVIWKATKRWAMNSMMPMGGVIVMTCIVAKTTKWTWLFWGVAAFAIWVLMILIEAVEQRRNDS